MAEEFSLFLLLQKISRIREALTLIREIFYIFNKFISFIFRSAIIYFPVHNMHLHAVDLSIAGSNRMLHF